jgi:hypothetical protein
MSVMIAAVNNNTAQLVPTDGFGAVTAAYGTDHLSSGSEVYTATTCTATWPGGGDPATGTTAGDLVVTQDGYWGVFVSGSATAVTVDKWRTKDGSVGIPTAGQDCRILNGKGILAGARQTYVHRIIFGLAGAGTFAITNPWGTALFTYTIPAGSAPHTLEFCTGSEKGLMFNTAIGFKSSAGGITATVVFGY